MIATPRNIITFDRLPPQDLDAEKSALASALLVNETIDELIGILKPESFYSDAHRLMYSAIEDMYQNRNVVDTITLANELQKRGQLDEVGGPGYLIEVLETVPHAAHAGYYAGIVRDKWLQRSMIWKCNQIIQNAYKGGVETEELMATAEKEVLGVRDQIQNNQEIDFKDALVGSYDEIIARKDSTGSLTGLGSGFDDLDAMTSGFQPGQLVILAARPSIGKTAFVCCVTLNAAMNHNAATLFISLEMSWNELTERLICIHTKTNGQKVKQGSIDDIESHGIVEGINELSNYNITIDDTPGRTVAQIAAIARRRKRQDDIGCIVVDYLQLIEPDDRRVPREQQVARMTRKLKELAKELQIPVIVLAQLNRGIENRDDKRPRLSDLRESGAIEQDADLVMFLHRPDFYKPDDRPGEAELILSKNRSGPTGDLRLTFIKHCFRFENYSGLSPPPSNYNDAIGKF